MRRRAFAKINLTLDVLNEREDGFHNLEMVMAPLWLFDTLDMEIAPEMSFTTNSKYLGNPNKNTVIKSIELMRQRYGFSENFKIDLHKAIPSQAGLGGGSSDAASAISLVAHLLKMDLSKTEMEELGNEIGKDVPFCFYGKTVLAEGTGEKITIIENNLDLKVLLVKPRGGISTKNAYEKLAKMPPKHHPSEPMITALRDGDYPGVIKALGNSFEDIAMELLPDIRNIKNDLAELGFDGSLLCGSGSCVFGLAQDDKVIGEAMVALRKKYPFVWKTQVYRSYKRHG